MNLIYCLEFNVLYAIFVLISAQVSFNFCNDMMHSIAHVRCWIYSCKWLNGELTFQFNVSRGTMTISLILYFILSHDLSLCLLPNHWNLFKVIGHTVIIKAINTRLYFYFPQGEDAYFLSNIHQGFL